MWMPVVNTHCNWPRPIRLGSWAPGHSVGSCYNTRRSHTSAPSILGRLRDTHSSLAGSIKYNRRVTLYAFRTARRLYVQEVKWKALNKHNLLETSWIFSSSAVTVKQCGLYRLNNDTRTNPQKNLQSTLTNKRRIVSISVHQRDS